MRKPRRSGVFGMRLRGVEPPRAYAAHKALNLARLPVPPQPLEGRAILEGRAALPMPLEPDCLHPSEGGATLTNICSVQRQSSKRRSEPCGPDQASEGDLRLHRQVRREVRVSADRARDRQGRRPALVLDGARAPREPREDRAAAPRPDQAAGDRAARRQGEEGGPARSACRSSVRSPPVRRSWPRRTSRTTSRCPT